jgi:hypothetical protein
MKIFFIILILLFFAFRGKKSFRFLFRLSSISSSEDSYEIGTTHCCFLSLFLFLFLSLRSSLLKENWLYVFCFFFFIPLYWKKIDCMYFVSVSLLFFTKRKSIVCILSLFLYYSLLKSIVCVSVSFLKGK